MDFSILDFSEFRIKKKGKRKNNKIHLRRPIWVFCVKSYNTMFCLYFLTIMYFIHILVHMQCFRKIDRLFVFSRHLKIQVRLPNGYKGNYHFPQFGEN